MAAHRPYGDSHLPDDRLADNPTEIRPVSATADRAAEAVVLSSSASAPSSGDWLYCHRRRAEVWTENSCRSRCRLQWPRSLRINKSRSFLLPLAGACLRHAVAVAIARTQRTARTYPTSPGRVSARKTPGAASTALFIQYAQHGLRAHADRYSSRRPRFGAAGGPVAGKSRCR